MPAWRSRLAAFFLIVGIILSPLRTVAATLPMLFAYDAAVGSTAAVQGERCGSRRMCRRK